MCSGTLHSSSGHCVRDAFRGHTHAVNIYISIHRRPGSNELFTSRGHNSGGVVYIVAVHRVYYIIIVIILLSVHTCIRAPMSPSKRVSYSNKTDLPEKALCSMRVPLYIYTITAIFKSEKCCPQGHIIPTT